MAPIEYANFAQAESAVRDTIQSLYNVMLHTANYDATGPHTTLDALVREVGVLSQALRDVNAATDNTTSGGGGGLPSVPRDLVQYVEDGRNPDIYTREFVELVRKTNQIRAGKAGSFAQFQAVLAGQIRMALPELSGDVDRVVAATGGAVNAVNAAAATSTPAVATTTANTTTTTNTTTTHPALRNTDSSSSRDGTPGVLTPGGSTPGPNAAGVVGVMATGPTATAAATTTTAASSVDMMGVLPATPQPGTGAAGTAPAGGPAAAQDTQMS